MKNILSIIIAFNIAACNICFAQCNINIRLSYKIITNEAGQHNLNPDFLEDIVERMNIMLTSYERGYQFELVEVLEVGGNMENSPSNWYDTNFFTCGNDCYEDFQIDAFNEIYQWNDNAINIYINNGLPGGRCAFSPDHLIVIGSSASQPSDAYIHLHEIGHYLGLCHTQGCCCGGCENQNDNSVDCFGWLFFDCNPNGPNDDDNVSDTLFDNPCWNKNEASQHHFNVDYDQLNTDQENQVDNIMHNIMSYHFQYISDILTERQLDIAFSLGASVTRLHVADGKTYAVGGPDIQGGLPDTNGSEVNPHNLIIFALNAAVGEPNDNFTEIILIKPGDYDENLFINKSVVLRATRAGAATIGVQ